jgi:hypothetical protein
MSTLLIDQRRRLCVKCAALLSEEFSLIPSEEIPKLEVWRSRDDQRQLSSTEKITLQQIWLAFGKKIDESPESCCPKDLLEVAFDLGIHSITESGWRKRVSRYLFDVRDQLDEYELQFFHVNSLLT